MFVPNRAAAVEQEALRLRESLLRWLFQQQAEPSLAVLAMADAIALAAVQQDIDRGQPRSLPDRLDTLNRRIEQTYAAAYRDLSASRQRVREAAGALQ